jgi:hypothetical protein
MPTLHPCLSDSAGRGTGHAEQERGMGAWRSRQGKRPADLCNTDGRVMCSAQYAQWLRSQSCVVQPGAREQLA